MLPVFFISLHSLPLAFPLFFPPLALLVALALPFPFSLPLAPLPLPFPLPFSFPLALSVFSFPFPFSLSFSVVTVRVWVCVLNPEILILPTTPEPFYVIVIIGICIGVKPIVNVFFDVHLRWIPDISGDAVIPVTEKLVLFVKFTLILSNSHSESLLLKVRLLFFSHSSLF